MKTMTLLFGGCSYEHEISIVSAITVGKLLEIERFIFLAPNRRFYLIDKDKMKSTFFSSGEYTKCTELFCRAGGFEQKGLFGSRQLKTGTVINLIHGADGEDGKIASLLEFARIDYIGPRLEASVLSFNKLLTKLYAKQAGVQTLPCHVADKDNRTCDLDFPLIVKPLRLGSSIGISVARDESQLEYALDVALEFDTQALIEPFCQGVKEYNLAGAKCGDFIFSKIEEPQKSEILDFDKKYLDFSREEGITEARIDSGLQERLKDAFCKIYGQTFEGSLIRCDFFVHKDQIYLNEINPVPGSMAHYLFTDFASVLASLATHLPQPRAIEVDYKYINNIRGAKGK